MERRADDANPADEENQLLPRPASPRRADLYPTIDGPLGPTLEEAVPRARAYFLFGFLLLPMLWGVNAFYFWPVLRSRPRSGPDPHPFDPIRKYVFPSAIGFGLATLLILSWATTFMVGGERLFGSIWNDLVVYKVAEKLGITEWTNM